MKYFMIMAVSAWVGLISYAEPKGSHQGDDERPRTSSSSSVDCSAKWKVNFAVNSETGKLDGGDWKALAEKEVNPNHIYAQWDSNQNGYMYVLGSDKDHRPLAVGTKIQGWRLGLSKNKDWFKLTSKGWVKDTDPNAVPVVLAVNRNQTAETLEVASSNWMDWGGEVDKSKLQATQNNFPSSGNFGGMGGNLGGPPACKT